MCIRDRTNIDNFRGDSKLSTWLYRIAINESITFLNKKRKQNNVSMDDDDSFLLNTLESDTYFDGDEAQLLLQKAILTLPEKQRIVFQMKYFKELKYEEMSEILDTSVGALKASYHHATKKIEKFLSEPRDVYKRQGLDRVDEAIELLREGLEKRGDEYLLHFNMALNYYKKGNTDKTLEHLKRAIDLDKTHSGAFLLNAYSLNDKGLWIQSILSFQMFLLLEPDSRRSKNAFEEMLQTMRIKKLDEPIERSFTQLQMTRGDTATTLHPGNSSSLGSQSSLDQSSVYRVITSTIDSLKAVDANIDEFTLFKTVNKAFISELEKESMENKEGILWTFYVPFFSRISDSNYYETFCRYISVSYYPESLEWWQQNPDAAVNFVIWFEKGDAT